MISSLSPDCKIAYSFCFSNSFPRLQDCLQLLFLQLFPPTARLPTALVSPTLSPDCKIAYSSCFSNSFPRLQDCLQLLFLQLFPPTARLPTALVSPTLSPDCKIAYSSCFSNSFSPLQDCLYKPCYSKCLSIFNWEMPAIFSMALAYWSSRFKLDYTQIELDAARQVLRCLGKIFYIVFFIV